MSQETENTSRETVNTENGVPGQPDQTRQDQGHSDRAGGVSTGTACDATDLNEQLAAKQQELEEATQRYLRLAADFDNFRRRTRQEMDDVRKAAAGQMIGELLPVLDNFERALASARSLLPENVVTGIDMIYRQLWHVLVGSGVQTMEVVGKPFDPALHEAFEQVETDEVSEGTVVEEVQKGYLLHGKVLRPALVKVAKRPSVDDFAEV